jgi:hypothetical protein
MEQAHKASRRLKSDLVDSNNVTKYAWLKGISDTHSDNSLCKATRQTQSGPKKSA